MRTWQFVSAIGYSAIIILSIVPGQDRPHTGLDGKWEHALAYGLVAATFPFAMTSKRSRIIALAFLSANAFLMELVQTIIPMRHPSILDALASSGGAILGFTFLLALSVLFHAGRAKAAADPR